MCNPEGCWSGNYQRNERCSCKLVLCLKTQNCWVFNHLVIMRDEVYEFLGKMQREAKTEHVKPRWALWRGGFDRRRMGHAHWRLRVTCCRWLQVFLWDVRGSDVLKRCLAGKRSSARWCHLIQARDGSAAEHGTMNTRCAQLCCVPL